MKLRIWVVLFALGAVSCESLEEKPSSPALTIALEPQDTGTEASLRGLCAVSADVAWSSGSGGTFLRTTDGRSWTSGVVEGAEELDFRDVHAFSADEALLLSAGSPARVYRTEDGGQSWEVVYENEAPEAFFDAMAFWSDDAGMAFSDPIADELIIIQTEDGGRSWTNVPADRIPEARPGEAGFAASGTCLAVQGDQSVWIGTGGTVARVFRSRDRGRVWSAFDTPLGQSLPSAGIFSLTFLDDRRGVAVGGDYQHPERMQQNAAVTTDGGETWELVIDAPPSGYRSVVVQVPGTDTLIAMGRTGGDYSLDAGRTWSAWTTEGYYCASLAPEGGIGWVAGSEGRIARIVLTPSP
ncbi:MAG: YCF48-related protein [Planctomycetota bacterium]